MPGVKGQRSGGHNAKSVAQHKLEGTFDASRHSGISNPEPPKGIPVPPRGLSGEAKAEWDRMIARLEASKTLSSVDDAALYQYVQLFAETEAVKVDHQQLHKMSRDLKRLVKKLDGSELVEAIGKIVVLQQLAQKQSMQLRQGHMAIRQYLVEFGMTPAARGRVKTTTPPKGTGDVYDPPTSPLAALQQQARALRRIK